MILDNNCACTSCVDKRAQKIVNATRGNQIVRVSEIQDKFKSDEETIVLRENDSIQEGRQIKDLHFCRECGFRHDCPEECGFHSSRVKSCVCDECMSVKTDETQRMVERMVKYLMMLPKDMLTDGEETILEYIASDGTKGGL